MQCHFYKYSNNEGTGILVFVNDLTQIGRFFSNCVGVEVSVHVMFPRYSVLDSEFIVLYQLYMKPGLTA
ncbi:Uncharacterized protein APZ42_016129 [Daphnia magna]|uniref:Uncharacterized protein n=1 Tax=Daphnia magna TaxID=35525 RepID=A0A0P6AS74_9CRUS|nr:Uncharacterized protein APZ42_016129 [Daphnia magna]